MRVGKSGPEVVEVQQMPQQFMDVGIVENAELKSWYESGCSAEEGPAEFCRPVSDKFALSGTDERKRTPSRMVPADCVPVLISPAADVVAFRFDWYTGEVKEYVRTWADSGQIDLWSGSLRSAILRDVSQPDSDIESSALALEFYYRALFSVWSPRDKPLDALREFAEVAEQCGAQPLANVIRVREIPVAGG
jgi:hypothetical protein